MYIRNKRGPSAVPCGTPEVTGEEGVFYHLTPLSGTFQPGNSESKQVSCYGSRNGGAWWQGVDGSLC